MDVNLLKVFVATAEQQSISLAAKELAFAQSNVTSRIKQLEKLLGHKLFFRKPKGVVLTEAGKKLYTHALDIIKKTDIAMKELQNFDLEKHLRIGSSETHAASRIAPFLTKLHQDFPKMHLELLTGTTQTVTALLLDFKVDIAFVSGFPKHKELVVLNNFDEEMVMIEPKEPYNTGVVLSYKEGCSYNAFFQNYLHERGERVEKFSKLGSLESILGCVSAGMGKTYLPHSIVKKLGYEKLLKLTPINIIPTCLVAHKEYIPKIEDYLKAFSFQEIYALK